MTKEDARKSMNSFLRGQLPDSGVEAVIVEEDTIEKDYGWIFFYQSKRFLCSGNISHRLAGNGPVIVRRTGEVIPLTAASAASVAIERYEHENGLRTPKGT